MAPNSCSTSGSISTSSARPAVEPSPAPAARSSPAPARPPGPAARGCGAGCRGSSSAPGRAAGCAVIPSPVLHPGGHAGNAAEPRQQLPVAANPAVLAAGIGVITDRKIIKKLDVGDQPAAGVIALDQVVAEDVVVREGVAGGGLKGIHVIDALAGEAAGPEQVLVNIGNSGRVRVHPGRCRPDPREKRVVGRGDEKADARLQNAVALDDAALAPGRSGRGSADGPACRPSDGPPRAAVACRGPG